MSEFISLLGGQESDVFHLVTTHIEQLWPQGVLKDTRLVLTHSHKIRAGVVLSPFTDHIMSVEEALLALHSVPQLILDHEGARVHLVEKLRRDYPALVYYCSFQDKGFYGPIFHFLRSVRDNLPIELSLYERQRLPIVPTPTLS